MDFLGADTPSINSMINEKEAILMDKLRQNA